MIFLVGSGKKKLKEMNSLEEVKEKEIERLLKVIQRLMEGSAGSQIGPMEQLQLQK